MAVSQLADVIVPEEFTNYQVENSFVSTAFFESGVAVRNGVIADQLRAGTQQFTVPVWNDLANINPNYSNDNPSQLSTPNKIGAYSQLVPETYADKASRSRVLSPSPLSLGRGSIPNLSL